LFFATIFSEGSKVNLKEEYFKRIVYKKDAISSLSTILNEYYKNKKVFFLSGKSAYQKFGTFVVNELNRAGCEFLFKFVDEDTQKKDLDIMATEVQNCKVVVALGAGTVCDCAKYLAKQASLEHILIASNPTTLSYFTPVAYIANNFLCDVIDCNYAFRVIIDEQFITKATEQSVLSGKQFLASFWEVVLNLEINALLFEKKQSATQLKLILAKLKDNLTSRITPAEDKLLLMDMLVDAGYVLKDYGQNMCSTIALAMLFKTSGAVKVGSFGALCQTASKILLMNYKKFFMLKKIDVYTFLDIESLASTLNFLKVDAQSVQFDNIKKIRQNKALFLKLNAVKNQINSLIDISLEEMDIAPVKKEKAKVDLDKCAMSFHILPFVYDCSNLTNILYGSGLISC
jgi:hypothetical protein